MASCLQKFRGGNYPFLVAALDRTDLILFGHKKKLGCNSETVLIALFVHKASDTRFVHACFASRAISKTHWVIAHCRLFAATWKSKTESTDKCSPSKPQAGPTAAHRSALLICSRSPLARSPSSEFHTGLKAFFAVVLVAVQLSLPLAREGI